MTNVKLPKNRESVFVVVRQTLDVTGAWCNPVVCGVYLQYTDATDYAGSCYQEWVDKGAPIEHVNFEVQLSTFYG